MKISQRLRAAAAPTEADLSKSLYSLVKYNNGYYKSEKQGMFLLKQFDKMSKTYKNSSDTKLAWQWARSQTNVDPQAAFAGVLKYTMEGFGKRDISKVRVAAVFYVVDSSGVVALGKAKVLHPKKDDPTLESYAIVPNSISIVFERPKNEEPLIVVPYFAKVRQEQQRIEKQIRENQGLIDKIRSIPNYSDHEILLSFINQLQAGKELSPKQLLVVNKFFDQQDQEDLGLGTPSEWKANVDSFFTEIEKQILPALKTRLVALDAEEEATRIDEEWRAFINNPTEWSWTINELIANVLQRLASGKDVVEFSMDIGNAITAVKKAIAAPNVKKIKKKDVKALMVLRRLVSALEKHPTNSIKKAVESVLR